MSNHIDMKEAQNDLEIAVQRLKSAAHRIRRSAKANSRVQLAASCDYARKYTETLLESVEATG